MLLDYWKGDVVRFAVQEGMVPGASLAEKLANLESLGYDGIELSGSGLDGRAGEVRAALASSRLQASTVCGGFRPRLLSPERAERDRCEAEIVRMLEVAGEIGVEVGVIMVPMFGAAEVPDLSPYCTIAQIEEELTVGVLQRLSAVAARFGQRVLLEPLNRYETHFLNRVEHAVRLCERVGSPHLQILTDLFHENIEESSIPDAIRSGGSWIGHVHLADSNRLLPGQGHTDFVSAFAALREVGYQGWGALECRVSGQPMEALGNALALLRSAASGAEAIA